MIRSDRTSPTSGARAPGALRHRAILAPTAVLLAFLVAAFVHAGTLKAASAINGVDVVGEGFTTAVVALWFVLLLRARPAGRVTELMAAGLVCFLVGFLLDFLDELWALPDALWWDDVLESGAPGVGLIVATLALTQFVGEQRVVSAQLARREGRFREHRAVDGLTRLYDAGYLRAHLAEALAEGARPVVLVVDVDGFSAVNRHAGLAVGDRLLQVLGDLLLLNADDGDLVCRYAGDRFACLRLGDDGTTTARWAAALESAVARLQPFDRHGETVARVTATTGWARARPGDDAAAVLARANADLERRRDARGAS
jgi:diguanylate cyclase (GGDEF)-like protein